MADFTMTQGPDIQRKVDLLKKIISTLAEQGDTGGTDAGPRYTPKERLIRMAMGVTILVIGLYSALALGLKHIFSDDDSVRGISQFLIIIGLAFCQVGAGFVQLFGGNKMWAGQ